MDIYIYMFLIYNLAFRLNYNYKLNTTNKHTNIIIIIYNYYNNITF